MRIWTGSPQSVDIYSILKKQQFVLTRTFYSVPYYRIFLKRHENLWRHSVVSKATWNSEKETLTIHLFISELKLESSSMDEPYRSQNKQVLEAFRISESLRIEGLDSIYYQVFPCLRIVQPGDFSIGPHADVAWRFQGRSRCSGITENPKSSFKGIISKCFFHSYATQAWRPS